MNPLVDDYLKNQKQWHDEFVELRRILLECGLTEEYKWEHPCYTVNDKNVVLIHGFKEYCAVLFMNGALLKDTAGILIQQTKNVQAARQIRYTQVAEILSLESELKAYVAEAAALEKAGAKVTMKSTAEFPMAEEFRVRLRELPALKEAFEALTPGRQRGYLLYFSRAKQSQTRAARVEKCIPPILDGLGLDD